MLMLLTFGLISPLAAVGILATILSRAFLLKGRMCRYYHLERLMQQEDDGVKSIGDSGIQKVYDSKGNKISEGNFVKGKRVGNWKYFIKDSIYFIKY